MAEQLALVEAVHHVRRDALVGVVAALSLNLGPEPQRRQDFDARPVVAVRLQQFDEAAKQRSVVGIIARPGHGDDRQETVGEELPDAVQDALEGAGAADRVIVRRSEAVDRDAELQAVRRCRLGLRQPCQPFVLENSAVGQHRRGAVPQRQLQDGRHVAGEGTVRRR